jgi:TPP-dependent trihydroxycyclohexane-1,2-dione (THcHDO) dehydratase
MPANRAFQNRKSGWSTRSFFCRFDLANEARQMGEMALKIRTVPSLQKQLQTALILSVTFI